MIFIFFLILQLIFTFPPFESVSAVEVLTTSFGYILLYNAWIEK